MALFNLLQRVRAVRFNHESAANAVAHAPGVPDSIRMRPAKGRYDHELLAIRDTLASLRIPFVFMLVPDHRLVNGEHYNPMIDWESTTAHDAGIDAVNMLPVFRDSHIPVTKLYLLPWDGHTSRTGNALAADALVRNLSATGLPNCESSPMLVQKGTGLGAAATTR
jgi:hypothetical protein